MKAVALLDRVPIFAALKALLAESNGDPKSEARCPPLLPMDREARRAWLASAAGTDLVNDRDAA